MQEIDECWNGNGVHVQLSELFNQQSGHIELGVDHIRHLVESRADGDLAYLWDLCQRDSDLTPPNERGPMLKWLLAESPVLARGLECLNQMLSRKTQPQTNRPSQVSSKPSSSAPETFYRSPLITSSEISFPLPSYIY